MRTFIFISGLLIMVGCQHSYTDIREATLNSALERQWQENLQKHVILQETVEMVGTRQVDSIIAAYSTLILERRKLLQIPEKPEDKLNANTALVYLKFLDSLAVQGGSGNEKQIRTLYNKLETGGHLNEKLTTLKIMQLEGEILQHRMRSLAICLQFKAPLRVLVDTPMEANKPQEVVVYTISSSAELKSIGDLRLVHNGKAVPLLTHLLDKAAIFKFTPADTGAYELTANYYFAGANTTRPIRLSYPFKVMHAE